MFHVSLLRKQLGPRPSVYVSLLDTTDDDILIPRPEAVLGRRVITKGRYRPKVEVLIQWQGASKDDATWENEWRFSRTYPDFSLADKVP